MDIWRVLLYLMHVLIQVNKSHLHTSDYDINSIYLGIEPWKVPFPKRKPKHPHVHKPTNKTMTVLHLSDWHVDPLYEVC